MQPYSFLSSAPLHFLITLAARAMSNRIHVLINGEQFGPYPEAEFHQHVADRKILKSDLVWRDGLTDWIPASELLAQLQAQRGGTTAPVPVIALQPVRGTVFEQVRTAAAKGDSEAQFQLSLMLFAGQQAPKNDVEAADWLRRAAEGGHAEAQHALGLRHANGQAVRQDDAEAVAWFRKAADQKHAVAQCALGYMLDHGRGGPRDYFEAVRWYRQ
ncbi:MAG TPA: GYF domain-containing protein, partial [Verrucomicrobiae bacterium]|nr:GYF domain-containing protein [Verrucomicrobiae bacterium]